MSGNRTQLTPAAGGVAYNPGDPFLVPSQGGLGPRPRDYHVGIDYAARAGTPIPAASSGEIFYSGPSGGFHHAVVVKSINTNDGKPYYSIYGHVDPESALAPGTKVSAGQTIGAVGTVHPDEGELSTGPHEHFGIVTQDAIDAHNRNLAAGENPVRVNSGSGGGIGFRTGMTDLFVNPDTFTGYADAAPYNARTYAPIREGLEPRSVPYLAQNQQANRLISKGNPVDRNGLSSELNRSYIDTGDHATDQLASIARGALRVATPPTPQGGRRSEALDGAADASPTRFLVGRVYDPSQGSPFTAQPAPSPAVPDGSLSINDAYLEYLKRLNAN